MKIFQNLYLIFQRKTNSVNFIPQIDGLRFFAISIVVLYHINIFVLGKIPFKFVKPATEYWWLFSFLDSDKKGVYLFFVISGFILALPFVKASLKLAEEVNLKNYFLRRLTRLEPPYFLVMLACFFGILLLPGNDFVKMFPKSFSGLFPSLASSLVYMHNIIFPKNLSVNPVAWSLEVEVQFYLLVPILVKIFKLSAKARRTLLCFVIAGLIVMQQIYKPGFLSIYNYLHYFLIGFLLVDLYVSQTKFKINVWVGFLAGFLSLVYIVYVDLRTHPWQDYFFVLSIFVLYYLALNQEFWQKIFSLKFFTAIGGMCYSIYLLHYNIIPVIGNTTIKYNFFHSYPAVYLFHAAYLIFVVLVGSSIFYLLIEKPCMDKDWPKKLWQFIQFKVFRKPIKQAISLS